MTETDTSWRRRDVVAGWFDQYAAALGRYAARRVGAQLAGDVVAETFRVALEQFDRFDPQRGEPRAWLYGIATNLIRRHRRTEERRLRVQARSLHLTSVGPGDAVEAVEVRGRFDSVIDAVGGLESDDRDLLFLVAWEEMTSREAAQVLGIRPGTVRSRLSRIRFELKRLVDEGEPDG